MMPNTDAWEFERGGHCSLAHFHEEHRAFEEHAVSVLESYSAEEPHRAGRGSASGQTRASRLAWGGGVEARDAIRTKVASSSGMKLGAVLHA